MKIRAYLLLAAALAAIPVILFSAVALNMLLSSERRAALSRLEETARATALLVDREMSSAEAALRVLARSPHLASGDMRSFYQHARTADRGGGGRTILFDSNGQQLINTVVPFGSPLPPPPHYVTTRTRQVIAAQKVMVTGLIMGAVQHRPVTTINIPVPLYHGQRYVLGSVFGTDYFQKLLADQPVPRSWKIAVMDRQGKLLALSGAPPDIVGRDAHASVASEATRHAQGQLRYTLSDRTAMYGAFTRSALSDWTVVVSAPVSEVEATARHALSAIFLGVLAMLGCALAVASVFGRRLVKSITRATGAATALEHGKVPELQAMGIREVDALHRALTNAGTVLAASEAERLALLEREQEARRAAEQQNRAKDDFLAMLGHELRNPLSGIAGAVTLLEIEGIAPEQKERARQILRRQTGHLTHIVDDLLDLARLSNGKIKLDLRPVDLAEAARATADALLAAGRTGHVLTLDAEPAWIMADRTRLDQIINNLLTNALKYTPAGGHIHLRVFREGNDAALTVRDTGIGISGELLPRLFDVFIQGTVSIDRSEGGLGIGLSVVRTLVELHHGTITAESAGPGLGSMFSVRFPSTEPALLAEERQAHDREEALHATVLLIEDNHDARHILAVKLRNAGLEVLEAADGKTGMQLALDALPDIAIVDIGLPGMSGYDIARRLRSQAASGGMSLVALSGYGREIDRREALEAGFDVHLVKPVRFERLLEIIRGTAGETGSLPPDGH